MTDRLKRVTAWLALGNCLAALCLMALAWRLYPGGYDWLGRDLSTLGRIFTVAGERRHQDNFLIYNFALLLWGMGVILFFTARAWEQREAKAALRLLIGGAVVGAGIAGIGIVPADAPHHFWHGFSSAAAILVFAYLLIRSDPKQVTGKWFWIGLSLAVAAAFLLFKLIKLPHVDVLLQKFFVLELFTYLFVQTAAMLKRKDAPPGTELLPRLCRAGAAILWCGLAAMAGLFMAAVVFYPGGFDWHSHWTSYMGNLFLPGAGRGTERKVHSAYMLYDYALALGGCALTVFWQIRARAETQKHLARATVVCGWLTGLGLAGIGMASTNAWRLHRIMVDLFAVAVFLMLLLLAAGGAGRAGERFFWTFLIGGSALIFLILGRAWGKFGQKILIAEVGFWLGRQGFELRRRGLGPEKPEGKKA